MSTVYHSSVCSDDRMSVGSAGSNLVLLPGPMDHDVCFRDAGFTYFGDTDNEWDADFQRLVEVVLDADDSIQPQTLVDDGPWEALHADRGTMALYR